MGRRISPFFFIEDNHAVSHCICVIMMMQRPVQVLVGLEKAEFLHNAKLPENSRAIYSVSDFSVSNHLMCTL